MCPFSFQIRIDKNNMFPVPLSSSFLCLIVEIETNHEDMVKNLMKWSIFLHSRIFKTSTIPAIINYG